MELWIVRDTFTELSTIGSLYVDNYSGPFCFTLEDVYREKSSPVEEWKIPGETAIPVGRYQIIFYPSPKRKIIVPQLVNVPGFENVQIHPGNTARDTEGCILVGMKRGRDAIYESKRAFDSLMRELYRHADSEIFLTIEGIEG